MRKEVGGRKRDGGMEEEGGERKGSEKNGIGEEKNRRKTGERIKDPSPTQY